MIEILICDDNQEDIKTLAMFIREYMNQNKTLYKINTFESGEELLKFSGKIDIVFLDIVMNGINGIQVGERLKSKNLRMKIIYTTSLNQYYKQVINKVHAFAYLEKPLKKEEVELYMQEALGMIETEKLEKQSIYLEIINISAEQKIETIIKKFELEDIYYFQYINRKIRIKTEKKEYFFNETMKALIKDMEQHNFISCHQSYLINMIYIKGIKEYNLFLKNGETLPIAQKKSSEFRKKLNCFMNYRKG